MSKVPSILKKNNIIIAFIIAFVGCAALADRNYTEGNSGAVTSRAVEEETLVYDENPLDDGYTFTDSSVDKNTVVEIQSDESDVATSETPIVSEDLEFSEEETNEVTVTSTSDFSFVYSVVPPYSGAASVIINNNCPYFTDDDRSWEPGLEVYPPVDELDRCRTVYACLGTETMPPEGEERGSIGMVKPSGWHTVKYPDIIDDLYLYNRCHLIGWQLGNENENEYNLITGTRYLNITGMLPYENQVADYIRTTGNHVLYRVTPYFVGNELVARGVLMEAESVEDSNLSYCVWCYNVQPGIEIDYLTGDSSEAVIVEESTIITGEEVDLVLNMNTKRAHLPTCSSVLDMKPENRWDYHGTIESVQNMGYVPCGNCHPF